MALCVRAVLQGLFTLEPSIGPGCYLHWAGAALFAWAANDHAQVAAGTLRPYDPQGSFFLSYDVTLSYPCTEGCMAD